MLLNCFLRKFASYNAKKKKSIIKKTLLRLIPFHVFQHEIAVLNTLKAVKSGYRFEVTWFMETDAASHLFGPESFEGSEGKPYLYDSVNYRKLKLAASSRWDRSFSASCL